MKLLSASVGLLSGYFIYTESCHLWAVMSGFFHSAQCFQGQCQNFTPFSGRTIGHHVGRPHSVHARVGWWTLGLLPPCGCCGQCCREHACSGLSFNTCEFLCAHPGTGQLGHWAGASAWTFSSNDLGSSRTRSLGVHLRCEGSKKPGQEKGTLRDTQASVQLISSHARQQRHSEGTRGSERKALHSDLVIATH